MLRQLIFRTLITNFGLAALGLMNSVLLSRWLGPEGRGEVAAAMLWPTLLVYLSSLGLIAAILYYSAQPDSEPQRIFSSGIALASIQSSVAILVGFATLHWLLRSQSASVVGAGKLYLFVIPLSLIVQYGVSILQGRMRISAFNRLRAILPAGYFIGTVVLMLFGQLTLLNIIILHLALNVIVLACTLVSLGDLGVRLGFNIDGRLAKRMMQYGLRVHVGNISGLANLSLDQVLMAAWLPPAYLGLYVVAVSAAGVSQVFSQAVQMVLTPSITQKETQPERVAVLQGVFRRYWLLSFVITLAIGAVLPVAIPLVFGSQFKEAIWPAEVLLAGAFLIGAKEVLAGGAQSLGNPWLGSKAQLWALVVTGVLLYFLLPTMGIMGAAIATAASHCTQLAIVVSGLRRSHKISPTKLFHIRFKDIGSALNVFDLLRGQRVRLISDQS
jgi:O-antigen/teichoic acid export membrane protein